MTDLVDGTAVMRYRVVLAGTAVTESNNEIAAWATYRALLRRGDLRSAQPRVEIWRGDECLHSATVNEQSSRITVGMHATPNDVLKKMMAAAYDESDVSDALRSTGYPVSNNRLRGWLAAPTSRNHQAMTIDELYLVVDGLLAAGK